eukprot:TRINITY_DN4255_c0_g2_i1.p1 TRINITY_DN4255_c0_g2~~TRINITY_DN4255_c0_g2_i1.p1  ORF type:complete len:259 (+),score=41.17 TRINITY_DN4255_c0_g2_i1:65-841(+)
MSLSKRDTKDPNERHQESQKKPSDNINVHYEPALKQITSVNSSKGTFTISSKDVTPIKINSSGRSISRGSKMHIDSIHTSHSERKRSRTVHSKARVIKRSQRDSSERVRTHTSSPKSSSNSKGDSHDSHRRREYSNPVKLPSPDKDKEQRRIRTHSHDLEEIQIQKSRSLIKRPNEQNLPKRKSENGMKPQQQQQQQQQQQNNSVNDYAYRSPDLTSEKPKKRPDLHLTSKSSSRSLQDLPGKEKNPTPFTITLASLL